MNKVRTDIAMKATKLNAQVQLKNLQAMYERGKFLPELLLHRPLVEKGQ